MTRPSAFAARLEDVQTVLAEVAPAVARRMYRDHDGHVRIIGGVTRDEYAVVYRAIVLAFKRDGQQVDVCEGCGWAAYRAQEIDHNGSLIINCQHGEHDL